MKQITSPHNEVFKHLKQLAGSAKHRRRTKQTLLEGIHLCQSYLQQGDVPLLYVHTDAAKENPEASAIIQACESASVDGILLSNAHFRAISAVESGVGIAFVIKVPALEPLACLRSNALLLDEVQDPGNMGTILRTAAAAGFVDICISQGSVSAWSPKVLRGGMGAHAALRIYENIDIKALIQTARVPVFATSLDAKKTIYEQDLSGSVAWLFGNEGSGVSQELLSLDVQKVIIPQNKQVESLNVAASVAVCLFEQLRQSRIV